MKVSDGQCFALIKLMGRYSKNREERLWILSRLIDRDVESTKDVNVDEWKAIRNEAYPNWSMDDWDVSMKFHRRCVALKEKYETEILGQELMF